MNQYKTPYFTYSHYQLKTNILQFLKIKKEGVEILYALKANNLQSIVEEIIKNDFGFDVASKEEIELALSFGANPKKISFSAPSKFHEDIEYAGKVGVEMFAADSEEEIKKICNLVTSPKVFLRIGVSSKAAAFNLSEKFGMTEKYAKEIIKKSMKMGWNISGISFHIGSQNNDTKSWGKAIKGALNLIHFAQDNGVKIESLNLGGGIPAQYTPDIKHLSYYVKKLNLEIRKLKRTFPNLNLYLEPGRAMVANTMALYSKIIDLKPYKRPPLIVLDTSVFGGVIEALEHFEYPLTSTNSTSFLKKYYKVGGYSCDGYDIIRQRVLLPHNIKVGDIVKIEQAGAYTNVFESFQMKPFPKIYNEK